MISQSDNMKFIILIIVTFALIANTFGKESMKSFHSKDLWSGRIIDGYPAGKNQVPWQVSIRMVSLNNRFHLCGGSIISEQWVMSAGHCVDGFVKFIIGIGSNKLNKPQISMTSNYSILHGNYNPETLMNDISLIKLPKCLKFCDSIQPVGLPKLSQIGLTFENNKTQICGWGKIFDSSTTPAPLLMCTELRIISNNNCSTYYDPSIIFNSTMCAIGYQRVNQSSCNGDSGGALTLKQNGKPIQIGIISFGSVVGCMAGLPTGYTRVTEFLNWISTKTGIII